MNCEILLKCRRNETGVFSFRIFLSNLKVGTEPLRLEYAISK